MPRVLDFAVPPRTRPPWRWFPMLATALLTLAFTSASAHESTVPWLSPAALDDGIYIEVRHPRVIRRPGDFDLFVVVSNLAGRDRVVLEAIRYRLPGESREHRRGVGRALDSQRDAYRRYRALQPRADDGARSPLEARRLLEQRRRALGEIRAASHQDRRRIRVPRSLEPGDTLDLTVQVDLAHDGGTHTLERSLRIPVQPPLPSGDDGAWFAGDQHLHTVFSIDAFFLDGTRELISQYAEAAQRLDLAWVIGTDHTNVDLLGWYAPWMFAIGEIAASVHRERTGYLVLQGQEMGLGNFGTRGEGAHLLVYPREDDSTGFIGNPCAGLIGNHVNCEPEQVVLDRVNARGGIGFIAHPFSSTPLVYAEWDRGSAARGWAGLEIFNSSAGRLELDDELSIAWWYELLREIPPPENGELRPRPDFPTRFPVGLGNSDAHQVSDIGATFSYVNVPGVGPGDVRLSREALMDAFVQGRVVASNGPLVHGRIHGAGTGEVARLPAIGNEIRVELHSSEEFGPVGDYEITVLVNGLPRLSLPPSGAPGFRRSVELVDVLRPKDRFVTLRATRTVCPGCAEDRVVREAISNPIWLQFTSAR